MSRITPQDIEHVALLSRLGFDDEQKARFADQLSDILSYAEKLNALDTDGVEPLSHPHPITNVFREDVPHQSLTNEEAIANAPESEDGCFRVPQIIQG